MFEGKSYGLVMSSLRKAMDPVRAMKAVFVFANYGLIDHKHETGDGYDAFRALLSTQEEDPEEGTRPTLRRGGRIMDDARSSSSESEADDPAADPPSEVKWNLPTGFTLGKEPSKLDDSLVGLVDLPPVEGLRLAARQDLRDRHTR